MDTEQLEASTEALTKAKMGGKTKAVHMLVGQRRKVVISISSKCCSA